MDIITTGFCVAFLAGMAGSCLRHIGTPVKRAALARIGIELMVGFMAGVTFLLVISRAPWNPVIVAIPVGLIFGYFLSSGTVFSRLK